MTTLLEAAKQALETLEYIDSPLYVCEINKIGAAITALRQAIANEALNKMAENERELGIHMQADMPKIGCVNHDCDQCKQAEQSATHGAQPVAIVDVVVPHLRSIVVKAIPELPMPSVGDLLYTAPPPHQPLTDADGDAFRTAAEMGLTLRFYGGIAQSSVPGSPSIYETGSDADRASAMRQAIHKAAHGIKE